MGEGKERGREDGRKRLRQIDRADDKYPGKVAPNILVAQGLIY